MTRIEELTLMAQIERVLLELERAGKVMRVLDANGKPMLDANGEQLWTLAPKERH